MEIKKTRFFFYLRHIIDWRKIARDKSGWQTNHDVKCVSGTVRCVRVPVCMLVYVCVRVCMRVTEKHCLEGKRIQTEEKEGPTGVFLSVQGLCPAQSRQVFMVFGRVSSQGAALPHGLAARKLNTGQMPGPCVPSLGRYYSASPHSTTRHTRRSTHTHPLLSYSLIQSLSQGGQGVIKV